ALDGGGQDNGGRAFVLGGGLESGVDLLGIVAAPRELAELFVGKVLDERGQLGILAEEMLPDIRAGLDGVLHVFAVDDLAHAFDQQARFIGGQKRVPAATPNDLDD